MSRTHISVTLRRQIIDRAKQCCEYCRIGMNDGAIDFAIDHIIAEKHGGKTLESNLCLSCFWCNSYKGSDISSVDWAFDESIVPLFNPRKQNWHDHFRIDGTRIISLSPEGRVTVFLLRLNAVERIKERKLLIQLKLYPCDKK